MPRISLKNPNRSNVPVKTVSKNDPLHLAEEAVRMFEENYAALLEMKDAFKKNYPEAANELNTIAQVEDEVAEYIKKAKSAVAAAGTTVGDFKVTKKFSRAQYDPNKLVAALIFNDASDLMWDLIKAGVVESIKLGKDTPSTYFDRHPQAAKMVAEAWCEKEPMTPSVSVPKI